MTDSFFTDPDGLAEAMNLPAVVRISVIGAATQEYKSRLQAAVTEATGSDAVHGLTEQASRKGQWMAYRYRIYFEDITVFESFYRIVGRLEGTRSII